MAFVLLSRFSSMKGKIEILFPQPMSSASLWKLKLNSLDILPDNTPIFLWVTETIIFYALNFLTFVAAPLFVTHNVSWQLRHWKSYTIVYGVLFNTAPQLNKE